MKYWCIDDDHSTACSELELLAASSRGQISVDIVQPKALRSLINDIRSAKPDGLIIDLRLDEVPSSAQYVADYRAGTLAQQLRSLANEDRGSDIPIVLWSSEPNLRKSYDHDTLSHDFFDAVYIKNRVVDEPARVAQQLVSYAAGYAQLNSFLRAPTDIISLLSANGPSAEFINTIVLSSVSWEKLSYSANSLARWILKRLMRSPGPLIDERTLAARLGVSRQESKDWTLLLNNVLKEHIYSGPFSDADSYWWALNIEKWWLSLKPASSLGLLPAQERVSFLKDKLGIDLVAAPPVAASASTYYWYICEKTGNPIDPKDGVAIIDDFLDTWNEPKLVSIEYALTDSRVPLQKADRDRLQLIKKSRSSTTK